MTSLHYPIWNCKKKIEARQETIINFYAHLFNRTSIPKNKQYWTICGSYRDKNNNPIEGEYHQMLKAGLIQPNQFHGVDISPEIISSNKEDYPDLNWHCGDFIDVLNQYAVENSFNPAIIYYDFVKMPEIGMAYLHSLLSILQWHKCKSVMVVCNLMMNNPRRKSVLYTREDIIEKVVQNKIHGNWEVFPRIYLYNGSGRRSKTTMGTVILYRKDAKQQP